MTITFKYLDKGAPPCEHTRWEVYANGNATGIIFNIALSDAADRLSYTRQNADIAGRVLFMVAAREAYSAGMTLVQLKNAIEARSFTI